MFSALVSLLLAGVLIFAPVQSTPDDSTSTDFSLARGYCTEQGGTLVPQSFPNGDQYQLCTFDDNRSCEIEAMYRSDCPVGGRKTTGYDTIAQKYCAWLGGNTIAEPNATCTLPDGTVCPADDLYAGSCS